LTRRSSLRPARVARNLSQDAVITERQAARRILAHLGLPTEPPPIARARDPTVEDIDDEVAVQLDLGLA